MEEARDRLTEEKLEITVDPVDAVGKICASLDNIASGDDLTTKGYWSSKLWDAWFSHHAKGIRIWRRYPGDVQYFPDIPDWLRDAAAAMGVEVMSLVNTYWGKDPTPPPGKGYPAPGPKY
jgi:hypothetical protein